ncbi:Laccase-3 [Apostasia shenzhenica]|uniref:Laccase n=1 Tax=Apostasia shenzhenica TaxID=1088818 RepID=A0A2I0A567_9ASPA|nr:Laccase-3 [Apostasia shenzhenica]
MVALKLPFLLLALNLSLFISISSSLGEVQHHEFVIQEVPVKRLCKTRSIATVNGQFPGPTIEARNGDTLIITVINQAKYNVTLHWHGIRQFRTAWADGPEFITQCPIRPGGSYTYRFTIRGQEGTLWWHAHSSWLRATVYGALIIRPKEDSSYPFVKPKKEFSVILGEWWDQNPMEVVRAATITGASPDISDAFTVNGQPGDLYNCSSEETTTFPVNPGELNLFRFINAALNAELFVSIAGHTMTVVAADASYTNPFPTSVLILAPGQTTDVLVAMDQPPSRYYIAARAYATANGVPFDNTTATAVVEYDCGCHSGLGQPPAPPVFPALPAFNDTAAAAAFSCSIKSPKPVKLPAPVDEGLFFTVGLGLLDCEPDRVCGGPNGSRFSASINNVSFVLPTTHSILQAHRLTVPGVFTSDFPAAPPVKFDFTGDNVGRELWQPEQGTKVYRLKYGSVVELVLQGTSIFAAENHPIHLHGYNFFILAEGIGNFDPARDTAKFNQVDPPLRNTVGVPARGWAAIRFVADNPGVWLLHCHLDVHITWGLAMVFLVEDGAGQLQSLEPAPVDLPLC